MADNPNKAHSHGSLSIAGFEGKEHCEVGNQIFAVNATEANNSKSVCNAGAVVPLNVAAPVVMQSCPNASSTEGIISIAGHGTKRATHPPSNSGPLVSNETMLGLELGQRTYFKVPGGSCSSAAAQASGPHVPRKHRIAGQISGCQVEGCKNDLSSAKDYHRRHKVCADHSKAPRVIVRGEEQRFCQQCSRFHGLDAFDEDKRSCRNRLEGHNKRRRKPQPDPFGLAGRFIPAFQDSSRLGQLLADRSHYSAHMRMPGVTALWNDRNPSPQQEANWQQSRLLTFGEQAAYDCSISGGAGAEQKLFTSIHHHMNDKSASFSPQSPKGMISGNTEVVSSPKMHQYLQNSANPLGSSSSLTSSSGAGVLSGLEALPIGQGFPRVSDSGRALSLQSTMQFLSSTQGMVAAPMNISTHSNIITDDSLHGSHIPTAQPLVEGVGQQQHCEWTHERVLPGVSSLHNLPSTSGYQTGPRSTDKEHLEITFAHGLTSVTGFHSVPMYPMFQGDGRLGNISQDVKTTKDLMQASSSSHGLNDQPLTSTSSFDLGMNHFPDLQALRAYDPSIYSSQEM
ncbi:hypothetical protein KP509_12G034000 [Ceratopteris richardii]|uniref:SBP-type domain-containing protein n=1 Tax=Ceratopteris richardii TaxID=49495 RepID=A0A8T2TI21_CERRI|nr:hypothetical protein KP509_12G034000 [Ceratopteris richardii]